MFSAAGRLRCGVAVDYPLASDGLYCLQHNVTSPASAVLHLSGGVCASFAIIPHSGPAGGIAGGIQNLARLVTCQAYRSTNYYKSAHASNILSIALFKNI